ncbi:MAG: pyruvate kinase [Caldimicrobium sp.]|nr:pyruvate kinase [Caldimicrobium sp.]MCX7613483.1 pyruvate kinase [Caldimicrobium sp.]MDW8182945.1 pyruvate kinase [Caldimicrobium sp.]
MKRNLVKILATLGPSSEDKKVIVDMVFAGAEAFRINMSHRDKTYWDRLLKAFFEAEETVGSPLGLIADLSGFKIRLGDFEAVDVTQGDTIIIAYDPEKGVPLRNREFYEALERGDIVNIDDGKVLLLVEAVEGLQFKAKVLRGKRVEPRKGVAISGKDIESPLLTNKDMEDLLYISERPFSHVMVSYARKAEQIDIIRSFLRESGRRDIKIWAKIEVPSGVKNIEEIAEVSDGIVIARGDLGMHFPLEEIPVIQRRLVKVARELHCPIVLATEFLSSLMERDTPTRSEVVDIYEAVKLQVDGLLLTGETAIGPDPVKAVQWMYRIISKAQQEIFIDRPPVDIPMSRLAKGLVELVDSLSAKLVIYSKTGRFAERITSFRPAKKFFVGVPHEGIVRMIRPLWGSEPLLVGDLSYEEGLKTTCKILEEYGKIGVGDYLVEAAWSRDRDFFLIIVKNLPFPEV